MAPALPQGHGHGFPSAELIHGLQPRLDWLDPAEHREIVRRVAASYRAAKADQQRADSAYLPCGARAEFVDDNQEFFAALLAQDHALAESSLRRFLRSELGVFCKEYATFDQLVSRTSPYLDRFETQVRRNFAAWSSLFEMDDRVLEVPDVGEPWGLMIEGRLITSKAMRFHATSQQIGELVRGTARPVVAEIDAAGGGQAYFVLRDYPQVKYLQFDLPETMVLSQYFLLAACPDREITLYGESRENLSTILIESDVVLYPNHAVEQLAERSVDVWLNSLSFGEASYANLAAYCDAIQQSLKRYLLLCNSDRAKLTRHGFERTPLSRYPLRHDEMRCLSRRFDLFLGAQSDLREVLYERV